MKAKEALYASIPDQKADEIGIRTWGAELDVCAARQNDEAPVSSVVKRILETDRKFPEFHKLIPN
jgi:hypothetical protein